MEQKPAGQKPHQSGSRPNVGNRQESLLLPSDNPSITQVPVTPGINFDTYQPLDEDDEAPGTTSPGYFSGTGQGDISAPDPTDLSPSQVAATAKTSENLLGRMSLAAMGRRQSLTEIRKTHPDLHLSGNIISATFNIPHSLGYNKGADWVSLYSSLALLVLPSVSSDLFEGCAPQ